MAKTHVVLVHGAYHQSHHYHLLINRLEDAGYTVTAPQMPSAGINVIDGSLAEDTAVLKQAIEDAARSADRIIPVFHSYGGIPGSEAVAELSEAAKTKIVRLIYLAALIVEQGTSRITSSGGKVAPWAVREGPTAYVPDPRTVFYHDVKDDVLVEDAVKHVVKQAYQPLVDTTKHRGWAKFPVTYVFCSQDRAVPVDVFRANIQNLVKDYDMGARWEPLTMDSGHSPFLSQPEETARVIRRAAGEDM